MHSNKCNEKIPIIFQKNANFTKKGKKEHLVVYLFKIRRIWNFFDALLWKIMHSNRCNEIIPNSFFKKMQIYEKRPKRAFSRVSLQNTSNLRKFFMHYYGKSCILTDAMKKYRNFFLKMHIYEKGQKEHLVVYLFKIRRIWNFFDELLWKIMYSNHVAWEKVSWKKVSWKKNILNWYREKRYRELVS